MLDIRDFFTAKEHNLKSFLRDDNKTILVPDYQRNFAWTIQELEQLWDDVIKAFESAYDENYELKPNPKPHFFGTILLTKCDEHRTFEVTDGQQRLTASTIFLKALLEQSYKSSDSDFKSGYRSLVAPLIQSNDFGDAFRQRLHLDETVNDLFRQYILIRNTPEERADYIRLNPIPVQNPTSAKQRLKEAHDFFTSKLKEEFNEDTSQALKDKKLMGLTKTFINHFTFLEISVKDKETAYTIFGTINNRGKDLTDSDIIKNEIFKSAPAAQRSGIKENWDTIIENINTEDLTDYLRFQYASTFGPVKKMQLFSAISTIINETDPITYLDTLRMESEWYARINLLGAPHWNDNITRKLQAFKTLDISHSLPLLLTAAVLYNNDENKFARIVNATLVFCFRYFTIGRNSVENLEREIGNLSKALREDPTAIDEVINKMRNLTPDHEFKEKFQIYKTKDNGLAFYILYELERVNRPAVVPLPHSPSQHIEHIMPKQLSRAASRQHEWAHVRNQVEYKDYVFRLGNLLILESDKNQQVGNKPFDDKKQIYQGSGLYYPAFIATTVHSWDFASITLRQTSMAQDALRVWQY